MIPAVTAFVYLSLPKPVVLDASAADLVSTCFQHYYDAKSLSGRIHLTQTAQNTTISIDTDIAFDRPSQLFIDQRRSGSRPGHWVAASDGNVFSYNKPDGVLGPTRLREPVMQPDGRVQTIPEMYAALGGQNSLGERSPILDIAIANPDSLKDLKNRWTNLRRNGAATVRNQTVNVVLGDYTPVPGQGATGSFEMDITPSGDILRFILKDRYAVPGHPEMGPVDVISNWEADLKVNAAVDKKLYKMG